MTVEISRLNIRALPAGTYRCSDDESRVVVTNIDQIEEWLEAWSDGWYSAVVRGLPREACFERTLHQILSTAQKMILQCAGAPPELADRLPVRAKLDEGATKKFIGG